MSRLRYNLDFIKENFIYTRKKKHTILGVKLLNLHKFDSLVLKLILTVNKSNKNAS